MKPHLILALICGCAAFFGPDVLAAEMNTKDMDQMLGRDKEQAAPDAPAGSTSPAAEESADDAKVKQLLDRIRGESGADAAPAGSATPPAAKENPIADGFKKAVYQIKTMIYGFTSNTAGQRARDDTKRVQGHGRATMDAAFDLTESLKLKMDARVEYGSEDDTYLGENPFGLDDSKQTRMFDFDQLFFKGKEGDFEWHAGKQRFEDLGVNNVFSPAAAISASDGTRPMDPIRLGVLQCGAAWFYGDNSTEFRWLPFFQESKPPAFTSRWAAMSEPFPGIETVSSDAAYNFRTLDFQGYNVEAEEDRVWRRVDEPNFFARQKCNLGSVDVFAQLYHGFLPESSLRLAGANGVQLQKTYPRGFLPTAGATTTVGKVAVYSELGAVVPEHGEIDTYLNPTVGADYDWNTLWQMEDIQQAKLAVEYSHQFVLESQNNPNHPLSNRQSRPGRNSVFAGYDVKFLDDWRLYQGATVDAVENFGYGCRAALERQFKDGWTTTLAYQWSDGDPQSPSGGSKDHAIVTLEIVKKF